MNTAEDFEQAARLWQQYWERLSERPRFSYFGLDIERSTGFVPGVGNLGCLAERED